MDLFGKETEKVKKDDDDDDIDLFGEETEKVKKDDDDDGMDLFGEETEKEKKDDDDDDGKEAEEDKKAKEEMKRGNEKKKKKRKKKKEVNKSHVILEIKGWDADQDLESLAKKIISTIKKDGLRWNTGYKLEEVAFGVKKIVIAFIAEDEKCSVQEIVDELESWENDIQQVEVVSFNKN